MAKEKRAYVLYKTWTPLICSLSDEDAGRLFKAIARYQDGGSDDLGNGYLSGIFAMVRATFEMDQRKYEEVCEKRRASGRAGGKANAARQEKDRKQAEAKQSTCFDWKQNEAKQSTCFDWKQNEAKAVDIDMVIDTDMGKELGDIKGSPPDPLENSRLSDPVRDKLREWISYKQERREGYKPAGLKALASRAARAEQESGAAAVVDLIEDCMSAGYKGVVWDRLQSRPAAAGRRTTGKNQFTQGVENNSYDFDALEAELLAAPQEGRTG